MNGSRLFLTSVCIGALMACAPSKDDDKEERAPSALPTFELAKAKEDAGQTDAKVIDLTAEGLRAKVEAGNIRLIDVRTDSEVAEGMIPGAEHIALDNFLPAELDLHDGREVILYCRSGRRSAIAAQRLAEHIGKPAQHLAGGIQAWDEAEQLVAGR